MMDGPWFGAGIMLAMIVGLVWWCWWAMRKGRNEKEKD
jgi:Flp pilus assembly protein TadB